MGIVLIFIVLLAIWLSFTYFMISPEIRDLIPLFSRLTPPSSWDELGNAVGFLNGLFNSIAILLGLIAIYKQGRQIDHSIRQQQVSNHLTAKIALQQFLLREADRLEENIQSMKERKEYNPNLFANMVAKKSRLLKEAQKISDELTRSSEIEAGGSSKI